ncbi:MAG: thiamine phosphate synthase [Pyrinomonadaceae bacterium]|nr:thiamine phosphate synthase [Phycisphaerales bacterium]
MHDVRLRIIDANANRAREALRVMEDISRFVLDDGKLCAAIKDVRHGLREALQAGGIDETALLAWRDTPGDVGTSISTPEEYVRTGTSHIAAAACKRLEEALRCMEECIKGPSPGSSDGARVIESLRYKTYDIEKRLMRALPARRRGGVQWRLCVIITQSLCVHHPWDRVAEQCIEGGADCLQLREKDLPDRELLKRARRLVEIARKGTSRPDLTSRPAVIINDRPDIAVLAGADGVHLGQDDLPIDEVRKLVGSSLIVGISTASIDQAQEAVRSGADYCGVGPMFATTTKHKPVLSGPAYLRAYLASPATAQCPHLAIGGITPDNIAELSAAGCQGVAVSSFVQKVQCPAVACRALHDGVASTH